MTDAFTDYAIEFVEEDPTELNDIGEEFPRIKEELISKYKTWAETNNVLSYPELEKLRN